MRFYCEDSSMQIYASYTGKFLLYRSHRELLDTACNVSGNRYEGRADVEDHGPLLSMLCCITSIVSYIRMLNITSSTFADHKISTAITFKVVEPLTSEAIPMHISRAAKD